MSGIFNLLSLPNCLIGYLLSFLDATSLFLLSKTCTRFSDVIANHNLLWRYIDARRSPNNEEKREYCINRAHLETHSILLREDKNAEPRIPLDSIFFNSIKTFSALKILALEYQTIDGNQYTVAAFPPGLEELSLKNSNISFSRNFFRHSCDHMKNLRVLILDRCDWVCASDIVPISKYYKLEIFSVSRCKNLKNSIPYFSLSGHGFKQLKVLDVRLSALGNTILQSFYKCPSLLAVYFQNEDESYMLDFNLRKLQIGEGSSSHDYWEEDDDDQDFAAAAASEGINDSFMSNTVLTDSGLLVYQNVEHLNNDLKYPDSVLYREPYNNCSCGYKGKGKRLAKFKEKRSLKSNDDSDSDEDKKPPGDDFLRGLKTKINNLKLAVKDRCKYFSRRNNENELLSDHSSLIINWNSPRLPPPEYSQVCVLNILRSNFDRGGTQDINVNDRLQYPIKQVILNRKSNKNCKRHATNSSDEPVTKKNKVAEDCELAGPSSTVKKQSNSSSESDMSDSEEPSYPERPPTPHPDMEPLEPVEINQKIDHQFVQQYILRACEQTKLKVPLRRLSLRGYKSVTDMSLTYINHLELDILDLTYTDITEYAINLYLIDHPKCRVIHEKFCVCRPNLHF